MRKERSEEDEWRRPARRPRFRAMNFFDDEIRSATRVFAESVVKAADQEARDREKIKEAGFAHLFSGNPRERDQKNRGSDSAEDSGEGGECEVSGSELHFLFIADPGV